LSLERSIAELRQFAMKADASGDMRVSISFKNEGDRARFLAEVKREFEPQLHFRSETPLGDAEMQLHGILIRIV
jgi:hypothetical protein